MSKPDEYDSPIANISWNKDGYFVFKLKKTSAIYDEIETINQFEYFITHTNGKPYKVIIDTRKSLTLPTDESFSYFLKHNKTNIKNAIIANNLPMKLMMGQVAKRSGIKNTKVFKTKGEALAWLLDDSIIE